MTVRRLLRMGPGALAGRARQEAAKRLERWQCERGRRAAPAEVDVTHAAALLDRFRAAVPARFFAGAAAADTGSLVAARFPGAAARVVAAADAVCAKRFDLLGYRALRFGDPVDWHLEPVAGRRAPRVHWSRLDPLDVAVVGDSKVVWELNRHQWLPALGHAYALTGRERYAEAFGAAVTEWLDANPPGVGINWASSLEIALRVIAWCWALVLFRRSPRLSPRLFARMREAVSRQAAHVTRYLSHSFSPNTHLTGEALGLVYAGLTFPDLPAAAAWRRRGARVLLAEVARQVLPDGVYFEQSTCYQRYTVETYLHFVLLARRNGLRVPPRLLERLGAMCDFLVAVRRPDGRVPQIGDADGGWLLPLVPRAPDDFRGVFAVAAAVLQRPDLAWAAQGPAPEALWLAGAAPPRGGPAAPPPAAPSRFFPRGGYAVMRDGWDARASHLVFDVGPLGCPVSGGHGHADLLSVQCSWGGETFLVDAGTGSYTGRPDWRAFFRSSAAHSTVTVDGESQAEPRGPFAWARPPVARRRRWVSTSAFDFADAEHDGYRRLPDPVVHRRRVLFDRGGGAWLIVDDLQGRAEHRVDVGFQFAPLAVTLEAPGWARARGRADLWVGAFAGVPLKAEVVEGEEQPMRGWISPVYGQRRAAPRLTFSAVARLPVRVLTLLLPGRDHRPPDAVAVAGADGALAGVRLPDGRELRVGEAEVVVGDARWSA